MKSISLCGSIIVDSVKMLPSWPEKGMLVPIESVRRAVGGLVCNDAIDLKALDPALDVRAYGAVGADDAGAFAVATMSERGVDCSAVRRLAGVPTSFTDVMTVVSTGERTFFNMHGADSRFTPDDLDVSALSCDIFHLGYLLLLDGMDAPDVEYGTCAARLLAKVRAAGICTSLDIVSEQSERFAHVVRPALRHCDYAIVNEVEAAAATGERPDDLRALCEGLRRLGVARLAVVHCPDGSAALDAGGHYAEIPSLDLPPDWIVGSVGAGDAFCSGMLYGIANGWSPEDAMRLGSCAAAANLSSADATGGARSLAETLKLETQFRRRASAGSASTTGPCASSGR